MFGYFVLLVALSISAVAAYYSIIGLTAIFAAAFIPIVIMGGVLEVAKITTAVWLHRYWDIAPKLMKAYLTVATIVLMFITSMGIFGYLSKAHIEQTAKSVEGVAQLERIDAEIARNKSIISRAEEKIAKLDSQGQTQDTQTQEKIDAEVSRIEGINSRLQTAIEQINNTLADTVRPYEQQAAKATETLNLISGFVANNEIKKLQGLIGASQDGRYGPKTAAAVEAFRKRITSERIIAQDKIDEERTASKKETTRLRTAAEQQIAQANQLINRLREKIGTASAQDNTAVIAEQQDLIKRTNAAVDTLYESKYAIESEGRKLEAEVGPVKYIAELVYGDNADKNLLEHAVRWVILMLVTVFDPLAVILVLAGVMTVHRFHNAKEVEEELEERRHEPVLTETKEDPDTANHEILDSSWAFRTIPPSVDQAESEVVEPPKKKTRKSKPVEIVVNEPVPQLVTETVVAEPEPETVVEPVADQQVDAVPTTHIPETMARGKKRQVRVAETFDIRRVSNVSPETGFGPAFPGEPEKGTQFVRTDLIPTKLFKYNGAKWMEISKLTTDTYAHNVKYIDFLIEKLNSKEYDPEDLSNAEREEIEQRVKTAF